MPEPRLPFPAQADADLERALIDVGGRLAYPATPDIAARVRERVQAEARIAPSSERLPFHSNRRLWFAAVGLLVAILGGLTLLPGTRGAIADRLGLPGVVIRWVDEVTPPQPSAETARLMLGRPLTLKEAQAAVDFAIHLPTADALEQPSAIYVLGHGEEAMVSLVYPPGPGLPASEFTGVGALVTQFVGGTERSMIEKGLAGKDIDPEVFIDYAPVAGARGYWITGSPHGFFLVCGDDGDCREERYRLAGNVLLWERDGLTLRLESNLSRDEALAVAESVRAVE